eukprot:INCI13481.1.p1 GENE.INCI13481.1~~INCI13481.1.p1  ORF type:complete len:696 (+),score=123.99 INCI13481.1:295-2382(+)
MWRYCHARCAKALGVGLHRYRSKTRTQGILPFAPKTRNFSRPMSVWSSMRQLFGGKSSNNEVETPLPKVPNTQADDSVGRARGGYDDEEDDDDAYDDYDDRDSEDDDDFEEDIIGQRPRTDAYGRSSKRSQHSHHRGRQHHRRRDGVDEIADDIASVFGDSAVQDTDLRHPHEFYPLARQMGRKVYLHIGPTNSGKTHAAVEALKAADSGVFCGPLRLLAWEMFEKLNSQGVPCNLLTGQEKQEVLHDNGAAASHVACTVEMLSATQEYDVAVIDEIQMIGDEYRGWAWTRAFLGCRAREVHLCGDETTGPLIQQLCDIMGEPLEICRYQRLNPLISQRKPVKSFRDISPGDCVVGFSRRSLFQMKQQIEEALDFSSKVCIVYGGLPPETRKDQARLFNSPDNNYNILVATDAIGMGLNLNIRRVIFSTLKKFDGVEKRFLKPRELQQIAGRAGRYGMDNEEGFAAVMSAKDVGRLQHTLEQKVRPLKRAGIAPSVEQLEVFSQRPDLQNATFSEILFKFMMEARCSDHYFLCDVEEALTIAEMLDEVDGLDLADCASFSMAPVDTKSVKCLDALYDYASSFADAHADDFAIRANIHVPAEVPRSPFMIAKLEELHKVADLYLWLSLRYPTHFVEGQRVRKQRKQCAKLIEVGLEQLSESEKKRYRSLRDTAFSRRLRESWACLQCRLMQSASFP